MRKREVQELCMLCCEPLGQATPSRVYNAGFDTTSLIHTLCLGRMIAAAIGAHKARAIQREIYAAQMEQRQNVLRTGAS